MKLKMLMVFGVIASVIALCYPLANNRALTEDRALAGAKEFVRINNIQSKRISCAGDSDDDGYGSCTVVSGSEKIKLQCPVDAINFHIFGAKGCKEIDAQVKFLTK